jgi:hypothetical protein
VRNAGYKEEFVNLTPVDADLGVKYILNTFKRHNAENVVFVRRNENGKDSVFNIPTKGFNKFYAELEKAKKVQI